MVRDLEISVAKLDIASYQPLVVEIKELMQKPEEIVKRLRIFEEE